MNTNPDTPEKLKALISNYTDDYADDIKSIAEAVFATPELGYKEEKTSKTVREAFTRLNIAYSYPHAVTGVLGKLTGGGKSPSTRPLNICIIGEMDGITCYGHRSADRLTGASHACGHNTQIAAMLGVATVLSKSGVMNHLCGDVSFLAAPAEEFAELEYRCGLIADGKISYAGGKQQLITEGVFDDVDMAIMLHSHAATPELTLFLNGKNLGFTAKTITLHGKEAHASEPFNGINALNAATMALMGIHANRETFRDEDRIRIHPIITQGGDIVNVVPSKVVMETFVRGANLKAIEDACEKVDRCVNGAAYAVGARAEIKNLQGYLPLRQDPALSAVMEKNAAGLVTDVVHGVDMTGSTDIGDLSHLIPVIQPTIGGFSGALHSKEFGVADENIYTVMTKLMAFTVIDLLCDSAALGLDIKNNFKPALTKDEYLQNLNKTGSKTNVD